MCVCVCVSGFNNKVILLLASKYLEVISSIDFFTLHNLTNVPVSVLLLWNAADNLEKDVYQFYGDVYLNSHDPL